MPASCLHELKWTFLSPGVSDDRDASDFDDRFGREELGDANIGPHGVRILQELLSHLEHNVS